MNIIIPILLSKAIKTKEMPRQINNIYNDQTSVIHKKPINLKRFKYFLYKVQNNEPDKIQIIEYTVEGDPIISTLVYDGKSFYLLRDSTFDRHAGSESPLVYKYTGNNIFRTKEDNYIHYNLDTTNGKIRFYSYAPKYEATYDFD